ncbi:beta-ketoacyl synthase domain-containing protein [Colletotrichum kahawae]|uniref:Beta-ketoacyl synthase domain-containing protein n=1 Tax=Colletotrichum kahawae TaxID=34407 RepID=A0AAE0CWG0_COLKA|nr:beta-ketoacyl synthase domain-containing protein [Colletotrichum kahawae]
MKDAQDSLWATEPIAIVGLSCKFAGDASNADGLWKLLSEGRSAWSEIPASRFNSKGTYHPNHEKLSTVHVRGAHFLDEDVGLFDAAFFKFPTETAAPVTLENAGLPLDQVAGSKTSVFAGTFVHDYRDGLIRDEDNIPRFFLTGVGSAMASNRVSHFFDFKGASMTIDTGCSTTLVALHQAVQSLRSGECDMSIVGGSNVLLNPDNFKTMVSLGQAAQEELMRECYSKAGIGPLSTQYFEAHGTGTATGDPIEAGAIAAVFQGHRRTTQGALRVGSVKTNIGHTEATSGLASVIKVVLAMERGKIPPTINFEKPNPKLALEEWRIKVATELEDWPEGPHGLMRASINNFGYGGSNAHVIVDQHDAFSLQTRGKVTSNGNLGNGTNGTTNGHTNGVNGHVSSPHDETKLLLLSAKDEQACRQMVSNLKGYLQNQDHTERGQDVSTLLDNLVYTLGQRRTLFPWVAAHPVPFNQGLDEVIKALDTPKFRPTRTTRQPRIGMVFTGQGAQWYAMGRELITTYPVFKNSLEEADAFVRELGADWSLMTELHRDAKTTRVNGTGFSIPICVAVQISLVRLLRTWGVTPAAVTSHSSGEIAAAYTVGAISFRSAMGIAYHRSRLAADMTGQGPIRGGMLAVGLGHQDSQDFLDRLATDAKAVVACVNSPSSTTVAGDVAAIEELETLLQAESVFARRLRVDTAYHSHHMKPIASQYREALNSLPQQDDTATYDDSVAYASPITGYRMSSAEKIAHPDHWVGSLSQPVQFVDALTEMILGDLDNSDSDHPVSSVDILVEVGPHTALGGPIQQILELPEFDGIQLPYYGCLVRNNNAVESLQTLAANLLREGLPVNLDAVNFPGGRGRDDVRVLTNLPSYPWNHQTRHWIEPRFNTGLRERSQPPHDLLGSLVPGTNPEAPSWRHTLRTTESPWVRDHVIQSNMLYPGCGFVSLAIEAVRQQLSMVAGNQSQEARKISGHQVRDVNVVQALVIPDTPEGIEIQTVLRPADEKHIGVRGWKQFEVYSVTADNHWAQHSQGLIAVEFEESSTTRVHEFDDTKYKALDPASGCERRIDPIDMWNVLGSLGIQYGPTFRNISNIVQSGKEFLSTSTITIADTSVPKDLPRHHVIHPSLLDAAAQATYTALPGVESRQDSPRVFQSIEKLWISRDISHEAGHIFQCYTSLKHADAQGIEADIVLAEPGSDGVVNPLLKIQGLMFSSLGRTVSDANTRPWESELCSKIVWDADPDLNDPASKETTLETSNQEHDEISPQATRSLPDESNTLLKRIVHKNPRARILDIGATITSAGHTLLQVLGTVEAGGPLAALYHFTSVTDDDFDAAKQKLSRWNEVLVFDTLNIDADASLQGFDLGSYDVVLVNQALGLASFPGQTLANVYSLLKPGGRAFITHQAASEEAPYKDGILEQAGFSGDIVNHHNGTTTTTILTTVQLPVPIDLPSVLAADDLTLITSGEAGDAESTWLESLQHALSSDGRKPATHRLDSSTAATLSACTGRVCVFLGEVERPMLRDLDAETLEAIKSMAISCKGLLWITRGGAVECENPDLALAPGFLRSLRNEYLGRPYLTLDLDPSAPLWSDDNVAAISRIVKAGFATSMGVTESAPSDFEYAVREGVIKIPRIIKDVPRNSMVSPDADATADLDKVTMGPLHQPDRPLSMHVGMPGLLDTIAFDDDQSISADDGSLAPELIEIMPRAYGVNFRDVMVAMGQLHERVMGLECAGIVTGVGSEAAKQGYSIGDKVFCLLRGPFGSRARIEWTNVAHMPAGLSFEEAASLPVIFCTAYIGLIDLARISPGDTVLIHAAAGGVGQAAIMMARHLGADIFVTVGTPEKRQLVMSKYGIPADRIFSSRDASFASGVLVATNGRGVDVVLNSLAGPLLQESFNILAPFGHFIEIGKRDLEINSHLEMRPFSRQASFSAFYLLALMQHKPQRIHDVLNEISRLIEAQTIAPVHPVTAYPIAETAKAFRLLQTGKHMGKVVLSMGPQDLVPVRRPSPTPRFSPDASYLLVGGMGGIGRAIAHWTVAHGAKNLVFLSRSAGRSDASSKVLTEIEQAGCRVKADTILEQMSLENYVKAIRPKVHGTLNLHKQFDKADCLDFFVILSSVVGVAGNASQSNYSAAGSYQDALARWRVSHGLPAVSVDLGAVKAIGVAAETAGVLGRLQRTGHMPLSQDQVLGVLGSAILAPYDPQVVVGLNSGPGNHWDRAGESQLGRDARFAALRAREIDQIHGKSGSGAATGDSSSLASRLATAKSSEEATQSVAVAISEKLSDIFMIPVDDIELTNRPTQYGIDSLVAVELRNMLVQQAAAEVSIFGIMQSASLAALAADVAAKSTHVSASLFAT